jgi:hypothetical protein
MTQFASIEDAIQDVQNGKIVIIIDDEDRENEGDLMVAAEKVTPEIINFMATHGRGLICLPMTGKRLDGEFSSEQNGHIAEGCVLSPSSAARSTEFRHDRPTISRRSIRQSQDLTSEPHFPLRAKMVAYWFAPDRPKHQWISRAAQGFFRQASSAKS